MTGSLNIFEKKNTYSENEQAQRLERTKHIVSSAYTLICSIARRRNHAYRYTWNIMKALQFLSFALLFTKYANISSMVLIATLFIELLLVYVGRRIVSRLSPDDYERELLITDRGFGFANSNLSYKAIPIVFAAIIVVAIIFAILGIYLM